MNKRFLFLFFPLGLLLLAIFAPKPNFEQKQRIVIEKVETRVVGLGLLTILKIKEPKGIVLELYQQKEGAQDPELLHREKLPEGLEAQVQINHQTKSLFVFPLENDHKFKILAPTLDQKLRPHLNAFVWNFETKELMQINDGQAATD